MGLTYNLGRVSPSVFTDSSLNVGIGAAPSGTYKFEVTGTAKVSSTLLVSGAATFSSTVTSASSFNVLKDGSDTGFSGPFLGVSNAANNVTWGWQLGASNQLALFSYASSTIKNPLNITITGNVGIAVTPSSWDTTIFKGLQIANSNAFIVGRVEAASQVQIGTNTYYNADGNWKFIQNGYATRYVQNSGTHAWEYSNASGTAGNNVTFNEAMRITSGGNVAINAGGNLQLYRPDSSSPSSSWFWNIYMDSSNLLSFAVNGGTPKMIINASGNVGIGATSVNNEKLTINQTTGNASALYVYTTGVTTGQSYGLTVVAGTNSSDRSFAVFSQSSTEYFKVRGDGLIFAPGIYNNTNSNAANVWVNSDGSLYRSTASSIRYKENINDWNGSGLDTILALKPKTFKYKKDYYNLADIDFLGLIAEEVAEVSPYLAEYENQDRTGKVENVRYATIVVPLIAAIQEQQAIITSLQDRLDKAGL